MTSKDAAAIRPVILCGGSGTRLWPVSTQELPKQFLRLLGEQSLLQETAERLRGGRFGAPMIVSGEEQSTLVEQQLHDIDVPVDAILLEPVGRNTAAAAALAAAWVEATGKDELLLLMPSDHVIGDTAAFLRAIEIGSRLALDGSIVTFGAQPTEPNVQYGYIEAQADGGMEDGASPIARFHEKPDASTAAEYLKTGRFFWNCGIFLARASTLLGEMRKFLPRTAELVSEATRKAARDGVLVRPNPELFARIENISIDHAVMEKTDLGVVVPIQMQWSDIGAWDAVWKLGEKDAAGNVVQGEVLALDTRGSLLRSEGGPLIATIGLENMIVITVRDTVFIAPLDRASEVKKIAEKLKAAKCSAADAEA